MHQNMFSLYLVCKSQRVQSLLDRLGEHDVKAVDIMIIVVCLL